jgi:F-type H+-transporting ATPase subunit a
VSLLPTLFAAASTSGGGGHAVDPTKPFDALFGHVVPHAVEGLTLFGMQVWNIQIFQVLSILLIFVAFAGVARAVRNGTGGKRAKIAAGFVDYIVEDMIVPNIHERKHARALAPLFLSFFFFILFMNLFGLVPFGATATASVYVPAAMAGLTFLVMLLGGMIVQGPIKFWVNLLPHGLPAWLIPLMFIVELIGLCVKPFALMVRLTANMVGGHLVLLSFMGLMFFFGYGSPMAGWAVAPASIGMAVFIMIIEGFVALLQAYIFTLLSIIFVGASLHPDH